MKAAVSEAERGFSQGDAHIAASYHNLAELLRIVGDFGAAEEMFLKAIATLESPGGNQAQAQVRDGSPSTPTTHGAESGDCGCEDDKEATLMSTAVRKKVTATAVQNLCGLYLQKGKDGLDDAKRCYQKSLRLKIEAFGADDVEVSNTLAHIAEVSRREGNYRQALDFLAKSIGMLANHSEGQEDANVSIKRSMRKRWVQVVRILLHHSLLEGRDVDAALTADAERALRRAAKGDTKDTTTCHLLSELLNRSRDGKKCKEAHMLLTDLLEASGLGMPAEASSLFKFQLFLGTPREERGAPRIDPTKPRKAEATLNGFVLKRQLAESETCMANALSSQAPEKWRLLQDASSRLEACRTWLGAAFHDVTSMHMEATVDRGEGERAALRLADLETKIVCEYMHCLRSMVALSIQKEGAARQGEGERDGDGEEGEVRLRQDLLQEAMRVLKAYSQGAAGSADQEAVVLARSLKKSIEAMVLL